MKTFSKTTIPFILFFLVFFACQENRPQQEDRLVEQETEGEAGPDQRGWFFHQRAYPYGKTDRAAAKAAWEFRDQELQKQALLRSDLEWQFAGPTNVGGRVTDLEITNEANPVLYVGTASSGIFRSTAPNYTNWEPIFDDAPVLAIGDIALAPSNQQIIYAGTGEPSPTPASSIFGYNGVYKSDDGGDSWQSIGLEAAGRIGKIAIDPRDENVVYVGALGNVFDRHPERGLYKSTNGGISWTQQLYINDTTGVIDIAIHPNHPDTLYVATWQILSEPNDRNWGGAGSGIYRSYDGGENWEKLTNGLPDSAGRIGIAIAPSEPNRIYAKIVNHDNGFLNGIYRSDDGGESWTSVNSYFVSESSFMWWFGRVFVHPQQSNLVYVTGLDMTKSLNGGVNFEVVYDSAHVDQHALVFNPNNPDEVIFGNDGGVYTANDVTREYRKLNGLPVTQFYAGEINVHEPEQLLGGTQDNGTQRTNLDFGSGDWNNWDRILGADGFRAIVDPEDPNIVFACIQSGNLRKSINGGDSFFRSVTGIDFTDRRNWHTAYMMHPKNHEVMFFGTQRLYMSEDLGDSWMPISNDLTTNDTTSRMRSYSTISDMDISQIDSLTMWVGTADGNVQLSINGGFDFTLVSADLPNRYVTSVTADPRDGQTAYATFSGNWWGESIGHIYRTSNLGEDWEDISGNLPDVPINDLVVHPVLGDLYIATDIGVFHSIDEGQSWEIFGSGIPNVVISMLDYYAPDELLIAATFGRGMYRLNLDGTVSTKNPIIELKDLQAFPNPATDYIRVLFELEKSKDLLLTLHDLTGRQIKQIQNQVYPKGKHQEEIMLTGLPKGMYIITLREREGRGMQSVKISKTQ